MKAPARVPVDERGLLELFGGPRGLVDAGVPGVVFAVAYSVSGSNLRVAIIWAVATGVVFFALSLLQRRSVQQSVVGLVGVGIMAGVAAWTGRAETFYLPSIIKNAAYGTVYLVSALVRWPLLGLVLGPLMGEGIGWRKDPPRLRAYQVASLVWALMFFVRVAVQVPLYLAGQVGALGLVGIPLGLPLFLAAIWVTYAVLRRVPPTRQAAGEEPADDAEQVEPDESPA